MLKTTSLCHFILQLKSFTIKHSSLTFLRTRCSVFWTLLCKKSFLPPAFLAFLLPIDYFVLSHQRRSAMLSPGQYGAAPVTRK